MDTSIATTRERLLEILEDFTTRKEHAEDVEVILEEFVVIPRSELPEIEEHHEKHVIACKHDTFYLPPGGDTTARWQEVYLYLAVAEHADRLQVEQDEAKRNARRDELAREMSCAAEGFSLDYGVLGLTTQIAIDKIIELEEAAR